MNRWKAAATHLALSAVVIGGIALTAFLLWYPYALYRVSGLDRILLVMLAIDLTAGPLLTLIVYRAGKPSLRFDLTVIALCQAAFLAYGLHTLWQGRPVFLVATPDTYTLVFANEIAPTDLADAADPAWRSLPWTGPILAGARMPEAPDQRREVMETFMAGGAGIERTPRRYLSFDAVIPLLLENAEAVPPSVPDADIARTGRTRDALRRAPLVSRRGEGWMLIDSEQGRPLRAVR
ncbi:hypothetical protein PQS31_13150 [Luteimonas sp BLCC-B24]|uniref:hypothetical protein n=1 Tax=Luteimonas sp. BLCC-B24 TaxID=3025317 RepID=UPI00234D5F4A|nr:hypothetical protein [Luteimonas sp. BLCC-B24]MDC7807762.1 hypothetical protein [Luteimonas sp. BLCC-B24]